MKDLEPVYGQQQSESHHDAAQAGPGGASQGRGPGAAPSALHYIRDRPSEYDTIHQSIVMTLTQVRTYQTPSEERNPQQIRNITAFPYQILGAI